MRILLVDSQPDARQLATLLRAEGHNVVVHLGVDALPQLVVAEGCHLVVLAADFRADGELLDVCRTIRQESAALLLLVGRVDSDRLHLSALEAGADVYLVRPVAVEMLVAHVRALLRRHPSSVLCRGPTILPVTPELALDLAGQRLLGYGHEFPLSDREFRLLVYLVRHEGTVLTRETLLNAVWGYEYVGSGREVDVYIHYLRLKLEPVPTRPRYLLTIWGRGYAYRRDGRLVGIAEPLPGRVLGRLAAWKAPALPQAGLTRGGS